MRSTVTIDSAGRIVVPRKLRDKLHLRAGDELEIDASDEGIQLRLRKKESRLVLENGMWVIDTGGPVLTVEMVRESIEQGRRERMQRFLGGPAE
jgi:AbrB family looped-hinge helix DNA binding protein